MCYFLGRGGGAAEGAMTSKKKKSFPSPNVQIRFCSLARKNKIQFKIVVISMMTMEVHWENHFPFQLTREILFSAAPFHTQTSLEILNSRPETVSFPHVILSFHIITGKLLMVTLNTSIRFINRANQIFTASYVMQDTFQYRTILLELII